MSSTLVNYASRVLSVDQESNSFVPIVGLNKTPDMPIFEAVMFAWRGCAILRASVDEDDMEVIATGARLHFMSLSGADPHGLTEHEAASIHVYTQETRFYHTLNEHLRGTDRSKVEPYKPFLKLLLTALHKIPASTKTLYRGVRKALSQLSQKFETGKPVVWWPVTSTASHVDVLENPMFMGKSGSRCLFTITAVSARDIQRYSALGSKEREFVLIPGSCFVVEAILDAGSGLTIVQMAEDSSMKLLKFTPSDASPSPSAPLPPGWAQHSDPASGKPYYAHAATGQSQWERPVAANLPPAVPSFTHGKKTYSGGVYEGEMKDGRMHGRGKATDADGSVYEGEWKDEKKNGRGKYTDTSGHVFEGEFEDDEAKFLMNGRGKLTGPSGEVYEGEFKDGEMHGRGKKTFPSGNVYEGEFEDSKSNGRGKQTWPDGMVYEGEFKDGKRNGRGKMTWPSGHPCQVYDGEWKDDNRNGLGTIALTDGTRAFGRFIDGRFVG